MADRPRFNPAGFPPAFKERKLPVHEFPKYLRDARAQERAREDHSTTFEKRTYSVHFLPRMLVNQFSMLYFFLYTLYAYRSHRLLVA
ncbi:MAG: hypothetical protein GWN31_08385 [Candidatus Thorarchaeota archaeon]|nr:hypothetical protein [Candidatus Thorarchaeota archaeon]